MTGHLKDTNKGDTLCAAGGGKKRDTARSHRKLMQLKSGGT